MSNGSIPNSTIFVNVVLTPPADITLKILNYLLSFVIIFGNSLTIISVLKFHWLRNNNNILVCSLSFADLLVGILTFVYYVIFNVGGMNNVTFIIDYTLLAVGYMSSVLHLAAIAVERYIGVSYPLRYHSIMTPKRTKTLICSAWGISLTAGIISITILFIYGMEPYIYIDFANISFYLFAGCVIIVAYLAILPSVRRQARSISQQTSTEAGRIRKEIRASVTLGIILLAYVICWTPMFIVTVISYAARTMDNHLYTVWAFCLLLTTVNSALNCFVYAWRSKEYRKAYITLLTFGRKNARIQDTSTT